NLTRLGDLTSEIRRQLGPLGRQAQTARRAAGIQAEVRDARLRLLADDITVLSAALDDEIKAEAMLIEKRTRSERALAEVTATVDQAEQRHARSAPALARAQDTFYAVSALCERVQSTQQLAAERVRLMSTDGADDEQQGGRTGRAPEDLTRQAAAIRAEEAVLAQRVVASASALAIAEAARTEAEAEYADEQARIARLLQAAADRREGLARLTGQVAARRSRIEAAEAELGRLGEAEEATVVRASAAEQEFAALEVTITDVEHGEEGLDAAFEQAQARQDQAQRELSRWQESQRAAETRVSSLTARCDALEMSLRRKDGAAALLEHGAEAGVVGSVSSLIAIRDGHEAQIAAALGWLGEALVVESLDHGRAGLSWLREHEHGQGGMIVPSAFPAQLEDRQDRGSDRLPHDAVWAADVCDAASPDLARAIRHELTGIALVRTAADAQAVVDDPSARCLVAVTDDGDVYGLGWMRGGSSGGPSAIEVESALEQARADADEAIAEAQRAGFEVQRHTDSLAQATSAVESALEELHRSDAQMAAVAEQLGQLGAAIRGARAERDRTRAARTQAHAAVETSRLELQQLEQRLAEATRISHEDSSENSDVRPGGETDSPDRRSSADVRDALADAAARARSAETEARLALRPAEERVAALSGRANGLEAAAREEIDARRKAAARRERRRQEASVAAAVAGASAYLAQHTADMAARADRQRAAMAAEQSQRDQQLVQARALARELSDEVRTLTSSVHQDEIARAEQRLRIEGLQERALEEYGVDPDTLVREYGPDQLIPAMDPATGMLSASSTTPADSTDAAGSATDDNAESGPAVPLRAPVPFVRDEQEKRLRSAERKLASLGRVNPLALEEFAALEERHTYLVGQVEDLRRSSADLMAIVKEVDDRVERVFAEAFQDTADQFEGVFARLFPGGEGRLFLTDPDNMLTTGVEVEARPPGKRIKRLSLLSGGERSLTAVAMLVAIFKARPSPFYIMDEVEAALDDTNLGRLITLFEELRDSSQLIVITHQKRTMEVADALYGVSMQGDGVTTVISQRLRETEAQSA
ncbi:MAG: chromosome segregation protein SMC, partial [Ornithinimicrobium sp.]